MVLTDILGIFRFPRKKTQRFVDWMCPRLQVERGKGWIDSGGPSRKR